MAYIGKSPGEGVRSRFIYTATSNQTTFSGSDDHNRTLSYVDAEFTDVYLNGLKLDKSDYTATSGTSIILGAGASAGDNVEVIAFDTFSVFSGEFSQDVSIGGNLTVNGVTTTINSNIALGDNEKILLGDSSDLQIYHDGSNSNIFENGTGSLTLQTNGLKIGLAKASPFEWMVEAIVDGAVNLYYDSAQKLATTSTGIDVTGTVTADAATVGSTASSAAVHSYTKLEVESSSHTALQLSGSTGGEQWI